MIRHEEEDLQKNLYANASSQSAPLWQEKNSQDKRKYFFFNPTQLVLKKNKVRALLTPPPVPPVQYKQHSTKLCSSSSSCLILKSSRDLSRDSFLALKGEHGKKFRLKKSTMSKLNFPVSIKSAITKIIIKKKKASADHVQKIKASMESIQFLKHESRTYVSSYLIRGIIYRT